MSRNIIIGAYLCSKVDPQRDRYTPTDDFGYIEGWYNSILTTNNKGVILHDSLSSEFVKRYENLALSFVKVDISKIPYTINDCRFIIFNEYLQKNIFNNVFITDISDVVFKKDPFELVAEKLLVGSESVVKKDFWWSKKYINEVYPCYPFWNEPLLNCGILGGNYKMVKEVLEIMVNEIYKNPVREYFIDMMVFNYVIHSNFYGKYFTGSPLHTVFKNYDTANIDAYIIHK
ncbi:MAG TPA: hypothetical protein VFW78_07815 [Bacteroidia bacterium]|nr:hypothetical protein [Bacteroidia bacterium]